MRTASCLLLACLIALAPLPPTAADEPTQVEAMHAKAVAAHAERLAELAAWCQKKGLYAVRDEVFERLLRYDPEHKKARKRLKYKKVDGAWVQDTRYKRPKNFKPANLPAYEERQREVDAAYAEALTAVFDACTSVEQLAWAANIAASWAGARPEDPAPKAAVRRIATRRYQMLFAAGRAKELAEVAESLRTTYPLDVEIRALLGEVEHEGAWLLEESVTAKARRALLQAAAKKAAAGAGELRAAELDKTDYMLGVTGLEAIESKHIRAVGTIGTEALRTYVAALEGAGPFFEQAFGIAPTRRKTTVSYLLSKQEEMDALLDRFPGLDPKLAEQQKQHGLHVFWADGRTLCAGPIPPEAQRELCLGVLFMVFLYDTWFGEDSAMPGWLDEGIARHLSWLMTGTRFGIAVGGRYGAKDPTVTRNVPDAHGDWLKAANARLGKLPSWDLRLRMGKGIDAYTAQDSMIAYVLAVYLLEGRPKAVPAFLERLGQGEDVGLASTKALGLPLPILEQRLRRFLAEISK
ncbi:MAG: hypothetical protein QNJ98_04460 [Planctomycetota bacterium]|nr:hypothetical protein [Planctomycetota bacterium]